MEMWPTPKAEADGASPEATVERCKRAREKYEAGEYDNSSGPPSMRSLEFVTALWPASATCVMQDGETPETWLARREKLKQSANNGNGCGTPLAMAANLWQTPQLPGGGGKCRGQGRGEEALLPGQAEAVAGKLWATPAASDHNGSNRPGQRRRQLSEQTECLWEMP